MEKIIIYIDGGSRGNPGPSAFGVILCNGQGDILKKYSEYIGKATNNEAEYQGLIFALKKAKAYFGKEKIKKMGIELFSDSQLLVKQMNGEYKVLNSRIQPLFLIAWNLKIDYKNIRISFVSREKNKEADKLVNQALDSEDKSQKLF